MVSGDQGLELPARPMLFVNSAEEEKWQAALLIFGNGDMETVVATLRETEARAATAAASTRVNSANAAAAAGTPGTWKLNAVDFYVCLASTGTPEADAVAIEMVRELLPLHSGSFWFSCISARFEPLLLQMQKEYSSAAHAQTVRLDWDRNGQWEVTPETLRRTENPEHRRILDECARKYNRNAAAGKLDSSNSSVSGSAAVHPVESLPPPSEGEVYLAPLREEHVGLVVRNWPWATSASAPALMSALIRDQKLGALLIWLTQWIENSGVNAAGILRMTGGKEREEGAHKRG